MEHYDPLLISVIMGKLPKYFELDITRQMAYVKWILKRLLEVFKNEKLLVERFQFYTLIRINV